MNQDEIEAAMAQLKAQFLKPGEQFGTRKQANSIITLCFRNTKLEDFHAQGYIFDNEMKNLSIEACARVEYLMLSEQFQDMAPSDIFHFVFEGPYKTHVKKDLREPMWKALRKQTEARLSSLQLLKDSDPFEFELTLFGNWSMYARH